MKVKKELRWLIFLIVPFIIILTIHVVIPVTFILNSNPIFEDSYLSSKFQLEQMTVRSSTLAVRLAVSVFFNNLINSERTFMRMYSNPFMQYISINTSSIDLNNAYEYSQNITFQGQPLNTTEDRGMWFSTGRSTLSELTTEQIAMVEKFKSVEPFLSSILIGQKGQFIHSCSLYVVSNTSDPMYFQYPSSYSQTYSNLNSEVIDNYYTQSLNTYARNNDTLIVVPFVEYNSIINSSMLVLCVPDRSDVFVMVGCMRINMQLLGNFLKDESFFKVGIYLKNLLVLSNDIEGSTSFNPQIVISFDNNNDSTYTTPKHQFFDISVPQIPAGAFNTQANEYNSILYVRQKDISTYYLAPILKYQQMITLHLITTHTYEGVNNIDAIISQTLKQLLIPVTFLVLIALFISYCVMNKLLSSIDKQLYQLESRLKFIVDGDINIEIPTHQGTEDIKDLYDQVKVINKLHRYSTEHYFRGYFTEKILKYNEALQFVKGLNYDTGNILQNMGQAAMWAEEWETARETLKESVFIQLRKMQDEFGTLDQMMPYKRVRKIPHKYKEMEVVLIRKIFKLNFVYFRYLELKQIFTHKDAAETALDQLNFKKKQEQLMKEATHYMNIQKKVFYPDYSSYSQCILTLLNQCKQYSNLGKLEEAGKLIDKTTKIIQKYNAEYGNITKLLKEKGSKNKLLRNKNKLTTHSRTPPDILKTFRNLFKAKITLAESKDPSKYLEVLSLLTEGSKVGLFTAALNYMTKLQIRKLLAELKLSTQPFETTQIFRQSLPWKTLHYGQITKQDQASFLRFPTRFSKGLERQYVFIFDCSRQIFAQEGTKLREYQTERCVHIFERLINKTDRISIIKHGTNIGVEVHCGLIFKQFNETVLKMNINESIEERNIKKQEMGIIESLNRAVNRVKQLKSEKVIIMFFRTVEQYKEQFKKFRRKRKTKVSRCSEEFSQAMEIYHPSAFGAAVEQLLQKDNLRNVKLILYGANGEAHEKFRQFFGLNHINRRIWSKFGGINKYNNTVYVIEQKHKPDIDRLLMLKAQFIAENHVFFL